MSTRRMLFIGVIVAVVAFLLNTYLSNQSTDNAAYNACERATAATGVQVVSQVRTIRITDKNYRFILSTSNGRYSCMANKSNGVWSGSHINAVE